MFKKCSWTWRQNNRDYASGSTEGWNARRKWIESQRQFKESSVCITWLPGGDKSKTIFIQIMIEKI